MADIYLLIEGKQEGPYTQEQVRQSLSKGLINVETSAWHDGLPDWIPVEGLIGKGSGISLPAPTSNAPPVEAAGGVKTKSKSYKSLWPRAAGLALFGLSVGIGVGLVITVSGLGNHVLYLITQQQKDSKHGDVFRVFEPADTPNGAWFGYLDRTDGTTTEIIIDFGNGVTIADQDRIDAVFVPTNETGESNHQSYRIYKVQGTFKFEHPAQ